jgi:hypothetical protein
MRHRTRPPLALPLVLLCASGVAANINFTWIQPSCSPSQPWRCLRGQHCRNDSCLADYEGGLLGGSGSTPERRWFADLLHVRQSASSGSGSASGADTTDGMCGSQNNGTVCGDWPEGSCCSEYGYCGDT